MFPLRWWVVSGLVLLAPLAAIAEEQTDREAVAARLVAATGTLRIHSVEPAGQGEGAADVTVCSIVSLGEGRFVTFASAPAQAGLRITLADGGQAVARLSVTDRFSGLSLLEADSPAAGALEVASDVPRVGATVLTAAAAGLDQPVVSMGIVGGSDRMLPGLGLPPLVQCDVRTTETSSGAAVIDAEGRLIGIVAATSPEQSGWTYAVPARHVERLLRARVAGQVVVLETQRPTVGLTLGAGRQPGTVRVERIATEGPAAKAGVEQDDLVLEADGRKVRSAYQVVDLILRKQPGDVVELLVERGTAQHRLQLTLAGGTVVEMARHGQPPAGVRLGPQLSVRSLGPHTFEVRGDGPTAAATVQEVAATAVDTQPPAEPLRDELSMLRAQLAAFEKVIVHLQGELERRQARELELEAQIKRLTEHLQRQP